MNDAAGGPADIGEPTSSLSACTISEPTGVNTRYQLLDEDGDYLGDRPPDLTEDELFELYEWMILQQVVDERMVKLQRRGEMGTYASGRGQEASIAAASFALEDQDWLFPYGREGTAQLIQGMPLRDLLLYWRGVEDANRQSAHGVFPPAIAIGTHIPVGVGFAWGLRLAGEDTIAALYHGEGHPSTGEYQEGMNFASVIDAPVLFYCQNNAYSISCPFEEQTGASTVAQKGVAYGLDGIRVDGNDPLAIYDAVRTARNRVLDGNPTIVESVTYRLDAHTTNDDPSRYRTRDEVEWWEDREPVGRFQSYLKAEGILDENDVSTVRQQANERFEAAKTEADAYEHGGVDELFRYVYDELPPALEAQQRAYEAFLDDYPEAMTYIEERPKG